MDKIYIGNGKEKELKYGPVITLTIDVDSIVREYGNHGFCTDQGKKKVRLQVASRREPDQYGNTHSVELDTWHPNDYQPPEAIELAGGTRQSEHKPKPTFHGFDDFKKKPDPGSFEGAGIPDDTIPF
jgi:hypothetical protein